MVDRVQALAALTVVSDVAPTRVSGGPREVALAPRESVSERVRRLQAEAKGLAREHIGALDEAILKVEQLAFEIADGGEAYPAGVRDLARRLADDCDAKLMTIRAISGR